MNDTKIFNVRFIIDNCYGFTKNKIYRAFYPKGTRLRDTNGKPIELICVIDDFGEDYAYPASWFEKIDE